MTTSALHNDRIPTDPIALLALILASYLLAKTLTNQEAGTFQTTLSALLGVVPYLRR